MFYVIVKKLKTIVFTFVPLFQLLTALCPLPIKNKKKTVSQFLEL